MIQSLILVALTLLAAPSQPPSAQATAEAALARSHGGKVWIFAGTAPEAKPETLTKSLPLKPAPAELKQAAKDGPWPLSFVAVFKKASLKGPMTIEFADRNAPKLVVDQYSPDNKESTLVYKGTYALEPDLGFTKGHSYIIRVGQIVRGKFVSYAAGELAIK